MAQIHIGDLNKADVLAALFNYALPADDLIMRNWPLVMDSQYADRSINSQYFDWYGDRQFKPVRLKLKYFCGRHLAVDLSGDSFDPTDYDQINGGHGLALTAIDRLRLYGQVVEDASSCTARQWLDLSTDKSLQLLDKNQWPVALALFIVNMAKHAGTEHIFKMGNIRHFVEPSLMSGDRELARQIMAGYRLHDTRVATTI